MTAEIWNWCESRHIDFFASYIHSEDNSIADKGSTRIKPETEFSFTRKAFNKLCKELSCLEVDLVDSRII